MAEQPLRDRSHESENLAELAEQRSSTILGEVWNFLRFNKKWWLMPIILGLLLIGAFIILASTAAAPIIYTLF